MRIKEAAIKLDDGRVFTGRQHWNALQAAHATCKGGTPEEIDAHRIMVNRADQGFVTECGRFVLRKAALSVALQAGQVTIEGCTAPHHGLFSEDILNKEGK